MDIAPQPLTRQSTHDFTYVPPPTSNCPLPHPSRLPSSTVACTLQCNCGALMLPPWPDAGTRQVLLGAGVAAAQSTRRTSVYGTMPSLIHQFPSNCIPSFSRLQPQHYTRLSWIQRTKDEVRETRAPVFLPLEETEISFYPSVNKKLPVSSERR